MKIESHIALNRGSLVGVRVGGIFPVKIFQGLNLFEKILISKAYMLINLQKKEVDL